MIKKSIMKNDESIKQIKGIGDKTAALFEKLGIETVGQLLSHYPNGYDIFDIPVAVRDMVPESRQAIEAACVSTPLLRRGKGISTLSCKATDGTGECELIWFNSPFLKKAIKPGIHMVYLGRVTKNGNRLRMEQPKIFTTDEYRKLIGVLQPKYALTKGLTNNAVIKACGRAIDGFAEDEYIPKRILRSNELISFRDAVKTIHFPKDYVSLLNARKRIVFNEFFDFAVMIRAARDERQRIRNTFKIDSENQVELFIKSLPYELTGAQKRAIDVINSEMKSDFVMNRLVQGDVGSGKTVVAVCALINVALSGYQGVMMAPTEVLARQHFENVTKMVEPLDIKCVLVCGSMSAKERREADKLASSGEASIVIGTHALFSERTCFCNPALVITDEQHRFGVRQREMLSSKGCSPHMLVMSATPIPRTLAIVLYGDMDISVIDEMPAARLPIKNCVLQSSERGKAAAFMLAEISKGHQGYIICPMVDENPDIPGLNSVKIYTERFREVVGDRARIECLHGKMKPKEKDEIMQEFKNGEIDILVSTTVVEVGVDVTNATVMMIENSERFGLAQLHQLRGRVGRGSAQSYCIFLSGVSNASNNDRLKIISSTNDGFKIAGEDLRLRGPGDILGVRQSGEIEFKLADIFADANVLQMANDAVNDLTEDEFCDIKEVVAGGNFSAEHIYTLTT